MSSMPCSHAVLRQPSVLMLSAFEGYMNAIGGVILPLRCTSCRTGSAVAARLARRLGRRPPALWGSRWWAQWASPWEVGLLRRAAEALPGLEGKL